MESSVSENSIHTSSVIKTKLLTALPLLLHTLIIVLPVTYLVLRQKKIYISDIPPSDQIMLLAFVLIPLMILLLGCIIALIKKIPTWSITWFGTIIITFFLLFMLAFDDKEDSVLSISLLLILIAAFLCFLFVSAKQGWKTGGLYGIALASASAVSNCFFMTAAPFSQYTLAMAALPIGLLSAFFIYQYQNSKTNVRIFIFVAMASINIMVALLQYTAYSTTSVPYEGVYPIIAFLGSIALLTSGPLFGMACEEKNTV